MDGSSDTSTTTWFIDGPSFVRVRTGIAFNNTSTTATIAKVLLIPPSTRAVAYDFPVLRRETQPHALPRQAQLERIAEQSAEGRRIRSPREHARFGWHDAPRRPGYRATRCR